MSKTDRLIDSKIAQNIFIWICVYLVLVISVHGFENRFLSAFFIILLLAPPIYIQNLLIYPKVKNEKVLLVFFSLLNLTIGSFFMFSAIDVASEGKGFNFRNFLILLGVQSLSIIFGTALKLARDSFYRRQHEKETELKLLKAQLNPHFLFNTLNNLYGLSVMKSDKLPNLMLKLSDLLRYSLYETKEQLVLLSKEVAYIQNYISLEKVRLENTEINFTVNGKINDKQITPMLFIVFVENAFKHLSKENSKVDIVITSEENKVYFSCKNTVDYKKSLEENLEKGKSGIGLTNAKKRLALMYFEKHKLTVNNQNNIFSVDLIIEV